MDDGREGLTAREAVYELAETAFAELRVSLRRDANYLIAMRAILLVLFVTAIVSACGDAPIRPVYRGCAHNPALTEDDPDCYHGGGGGH